MPPLTKAWLSAARVRRKLGRRLRPVTSREELVARHAAGRSFVDVGCMWHIDGALAFLAEESGATAVTGVDIMPASERFKSEQLRRDSIVRFVQGDLHDQATTEAIGVHDVVWCSGVLYHAPNPLLTLERLRAITGELLMLATEALPEAPGLHGACVFYPGLRDSDRRAYVPIGGGERIGVTKPFDPAQGYVNWYWGITPSALEGMLRATGFELVETVGNPFHITALARPV